MTPSRFRKSCSHLLLLILASVTTGCLNMPTAPSQITATYNSGIAYEGFDGSRLRVELDDLSRRESQLMVAQEQRINTSEIQAFWMGYGQGDGIEASELASVRGKIEAVKKALAIKEIEVESNAKLEDSEPVPEK